MSEIHRLNFRLFVKNNKKTILDLIKDHILITIFYRYFEIISEESKFYNKPDSLFCREHAKKTFFNTAKPNLNFNRNEAVYIGDIPHYQGNPKNN